MNSQILRNIFLEKRDRILKELFLNQNNIQKIYNLGAIYEKRIILKRYFLPVKIHLLNSDYNYLNIFRYNNY